MTYPNPSPLTLDDTIVYLTIHSDSDTQVLQRDLDKLAEWETQWKMEFHPDKCEVLRVGRKRAMVQNDYILHGKRLQTGDSAKYLGVTVASDLRWNKHIDIITSSSQMLLFSNNANTSQMLSRMSHSSA